MKNMVVLITSLALITVIFGTTFVIGQQSIRLAANMPQIQAAQDAAQSLNDGIRPEDAISSAKKVNVAESSAGFIVIYDKSGKPISSSGELRGAAPVIPFGVLQHTKTPGYNAVTWEPEKGVRLATIEVVVGDYYVLAGRSLREPEKLIDTIIKLTGFGYAVSLVLLCAGWFGYVKAKNWKDS